MTTRPTPEQLRDARSRVLRSEKALDMLWRDYPKIRLLVLRATQDLNFCESLPPQVIRGICSMLSSIDMVREARKVLELGEMLAMDEDETDALDDSIEIIRRFRRAALDVDFDALRALVAETTCYATGDDRR